MINSIKRLFVKAASILALAGLCFGQQSCTPELTDTTEFSIYYYGITDIGPSQTMILESPSYIGEKPSDFQIYNITLDGNRIETESFKINPEHGSITVDNTDDLAVGLYSLSISCISAGRTYQFENAVSVNMMKKVPEGITVEPAELQADYGDITDIFSEKELPAAQVMTEKDHISISRYQIAAVYLQKGKEKTKIEKNDFFTISDKGVISISRGKSSIRPGVYTLDLKLMTAVVSEDPEEGLFKDAIRINITSRPLSLSYSPDNGKAEIGNESSSPDPLFEGSLEGISYEISKVVPEGTPVKIDPASGVITIDKTNTLAIGETCTVSVKVTNSFGTASFDDIYTFSVVDFIAPVEAFSYADVEILEDSGKKISPAEKSGAEVTYSFVGLDAALAESIQLDTQTGDITVSKDNGIPAGTYTLKVKAENIKGSKEAQFTLVIKKNPYKVTYLYYGNNIGLDDSADNAKDLPASQYRYLSLTDLKGKTYSIRKSDIPEGVKARYKLNNVSSLSLKDVTIDENTGEITIATGEADWQDGRTYAVIVEVTVGLDEAGQELEGACTMRTAVFFHNANPVGGVSINYTPFVFKINPVTGGKSVAPTVTGCDMDKLRMDYRREVVYGNLNGPKEHLSGKCPKQKNGTEEDETEKKETRRFLTRVWKQYFNSFEPKLPINYGQKKPMSYNENLSAKSLGKAVGYVEKGTFSMVINGNKWVDEYGPANGIMTGQFTFLSNGSDDEKALNNSKDQIFPFMVWFDTRF